MIVLKSPFETGGAFFSGSGATAGCHGGGRSRRSTENENVGCTGLGLDGRLHDIHDND